MACGTAWRVNAFFHGLLGVCVLVGLPRTGPGAENANPEVGGKQLSSVGSPYFEIVGEDFRSVAFVLDLSEQIAERCALYLELPERYPQRVLVSLLPEGAGDADRFFRIRTERGGFVTLYLRWDETLGLEELCFALTDALLVRQAVFNAGFEAAAGVRHWAVPALSGEVYLSLRPAQRQSFVDTLENELAGVPLSLLLEEKRHDPESLVDLRSGYWITSALREYGWNTAEVGEALRAALMGIDVAAGMAARMKEADSGAAFDLEAWWSAFRDAAIRRSQPWFDGLAQSREWILEFSRFEFGAGADRSGGNLRALWKYRSDPDLRAVVEARLQLLRLRMERVNPAYHNAAQSLGVLLETVLQSDAEHRFIGALARFLGDFEDARRMEAEIEAALQ